MKRIKRLSKILRGLCIIGLIITPVMHAAALRNPVFSKFCAMPDQVRVLARLLGSEQMAETIVMTASNLTSGALSLVGLYLLIRLFGLYSREQVFTQDDVSALRRIGYFLVIQAAVDQIFRLLLCPLRTESLIDATAGVVVFGIEITATICYVALVFLLMWIMDDRRRSLQMQTETNGERIRQVSKILRLLCLFALVLLPLWEVLFWYQIEYWRALSIYDFTGYWPRVADHWPMSGPSKITGFVARLVPLIVTMIALGSLTKLLSLVSRGDAFSAAAGRSARVIGYAIIIGQILRPFYDVLTQIAFLINAPAHDQTGGIAFGSANLILITFGLMMLLLGHILDQGRKLEEWPQKHVEAC